MVRGGNAGASLGARSTPTSLRKARWRSFGARCCVCQVADQPDPVAAWRAHSEAQKRVIDFLSRHAVRSVRFVDPTLCGGRWTVTDLTVGLTDRPAWVGAAAVTPRGVQFLPNMPTEEVFSTPHRQRTQGWVRVTKVGLPVHARGQRHLRALCGR